MAYAKGLCAKHGLSLGEHKLGGKCAGNGFTHMKLSCCAK